VSLTYAFLNSSIRMLLAVPIAVALVRHQSVTTLWLFGVAAASDGLDGFLAKRFGWRTDLGGILDPVADKLLMATVFVILALLGSVPPWLTTAVIARDCIIVLGGDQLPSLAWARQGPAVHGEQAQYAVPGDFRSRGHRGTAVRVAACLGSVARGVGIRDRGRERYRLRFGLRASSSRTGEAPAPYRSRRRIEPGMKQLALGCDCAPRRSSIAFHRARIRNSSRRCKALPPSRCGCGAVMGPEKTHLLQAVCAAARTAAYLPLDRSSTLPPAALVGFESCRVLCLDDVDAVAGDLAWEHALFRLFNDAAELRTRLIFAAGAAPRQLAWSLDDWRSRAAACVVYQLHDLG